MTFTARLKAKRQISVHKTRSFTKGEVRRWKSYENIFCRRYFMILFQHSNSNQEEFHSSVSPAL